MSSVFYVLALLNLPQLYMSTYFTRGIESFNELRISLSRLNAFLTLPEPPMPSHLKVGRCTSIHLAPVAISCSLRLPDLYFHRSPIEFLCSVGEGSGSNAVMWL